MRPNKPEGVKMKLQVNISKLKSIKELTIELPIKKGIYAITGQNATGKSTLVAATATAFYNAPMNRYFGKSVGTGTSISFKMGNETKTWEFADNKWNMTGHIRLKGFYEGSIIFGNRFKDATFNSLDKIERVSDRDLVAGDEFVRGNLGLILHNNEKFYEKLVTIDNPQARLRLGFVGVPYFYVKDNRRVSQYHMSTGENLLITILHSILERIGDRRELSTPCLLLLDEIELALHPSSLSRLLIFLRKIAHSHNMAIYFSTHSIELIREVSPENIFFLDRMVDDSVSIVNPCYPSYATRILYDHSGYDVVVLVEDDLSKIIVERLLRKLRLLENRLVHVMPCGGWTNVLKLAAEVVASNLLSKPSRIIIILDRDIQGSVPSYMIKADMKLNVPVNYLPMQSLEKFIRKHLFETVDHNLHRFLDSYLFLQKGLNTIMEEYKNSNHHNEDSNGKLLYRHIDAELDLRDKRRSDLIELIVDYMFQQNVENVTETESFLNKEFRNP
jgi:energy-coupling factor transporter ATP-binding protein EcfA2